MISEVDSGSAFGQVMCFVLTVPLSTQEYKWVAEISQESLIKCQRGGGEESWGVAGVGWTDILSRGYVGSNTPSCFI